MREKNAFAREFLWKILIDLEAPEAVQGLPWILPHLEGEDRAHYALNIGRIGPPAISAAPAIERSLEGADPTERRFIADALHRVRGARKATAADLLAAIRFPGDPTVSPYPHDLWRDLAELGEAARASLPEMIELARRDGGLDAYETEALLATGPTGEAALRRLLGDFEVRFDASPMVLLLEHLGDRADSVAEAILHRFRASVADSWQPLAAIKALGPAAAPAVPSLLILLDRETDHEKRTKLIEVLRAIGPNAHAATEALRRIAQSDDTRLNWRAERALWAIRHR